MHHFTRLPPRAVAVVVYGYSQPIDERKADRMQAPVHRSMEEAPLDREQSQNSRWPGGVRCIRLLCIRLPERNLLFMSVKAC